MSGFWDWFDEFEIDARRRGDRERTRLGEMHRLAYRFRESDPDRALVLYAEGRHLATVLHEPWWALYYDQQRVHALLHFKQDYRDVLDLAIGNVLEVRKPSYASFPRRLMIHVDLVSAYLGIDPVGYADAIRQALEYLDSQTPPSGDERYLLLGNQRQLALDLGQLDTADALCQRSLTLAAEDDERGRADHFLVFTYAALAEVAWKRGDSAALEDAALLGAELARRVGHQVELAGFLMWQALLARRAGADALAARLHRQASASISRLRMPPDAAYRDAECAYFEDAGQLDLALAARDAETAHLRDRGQVYLESTAHIKRCALLGRMHRLTDRDLQTARQAASRLRDPAQALEALARIESGERSAP
jgi:hypothetical protein